jgi:phage terminase large subunit-like protein
MSYLTDTSKNDLGKYYFDEQAAKDSVRYIETYVCHSKGDLEGTPLRLQEWQKIIVRDLFGWKKTEPHIIRDAEGKEVDRVNQRKYTFAYLEVPKKNGKSTLLSGFAQLFLDVEPERGAEVVGLAWGRKQARIIFEMVSKSIKHSPRARSKLKVFQHAILSKNNNKRYTVWSSESGGEDGQAPNLVIIDELHQHKKADLVEMAEKSMASRSNPLSLIITTAGDNLNGIGYERRQRAEKVAAGIVEDESLYVAIYCADKEDDPFLESTWIKANPNYGVSVQKSFLADLAHKAKVSAAALNSFKRYHLNIWNNSADSWLNDEVFKLCEWDIDESILEEADCIGGLDLSSYKDITAFTLLFQIPIDKRLNKIINDKIKANFDGVYIEKDFTSEAAYISKNWFFLPQAHEVRDVDDEKIRMYSTWVRDGHIIETEGNIVDYDYVRGFISGLKKRFNIVAIGYDPYNAIHIVPKMQEEGHEMIEVPQGWKHMAEPTKTLEQLITSYRLNHLGNPVLRWMGSNAVAKRDNNGNIILQKDKNYTKIDGIISNIIALRILQDPEFQPQRSIYENKDFEVW